MTKRSGLKLPANLMAVWLMLASAWKVLAVDPVVSNVQAKQRGGSRLVDITYDVADPDSPTLTVYLKVSPDGGKTWRGPVELVSGDVGRGIVPGGGKRLVWDAGKEKPNQFGVKYRYRIGASDQWLGDPGMALIPAGPFQMGDDRVVGPNDIGAFPVHTVTLSVFAIDKLEVSIELWESIRSWGNTNGYDLIAGGNSGPKHPVHSVNWFDVVKWCNARSEKEGKVPAYYEDTAMGVVYRSGEKAPTGVKWDAGYRLPTEAEWEKAARGGVSGKLYPWGTDEFSNELAAFGGIKPVGSYKPNGYQLYDMAGNVWEWCWDWFGDYTVDPQTNPKGSNTGFRGHWYRLVRGGGWIGSKPQMDLPVASRYNLHSPDGRHPNNGFRSVLPSGQP